MELVDCIPRTANSDSYVGSSALEEGVVDVSLELCGSWNGRDNWGIHLWVIVSRSLTDLLTCYAEERRARREARLRDLEAKRVMHRDRDGRSAKPPIRFGIRSHARNLISAIMAHPPPSRFSVLSSSSAELLSPTNSSTRFSLPSAPSVVTAPIGTPKPLSRPNIYDRPLNKTRTAEVSASAFAFLFSEVVQYMQKRVSGINDLERRYAPTIALTRIGFPTDYLLQV